jgi:hypothetical protein
LIDEWHTVTDLYRLMNVPNAVWIDENMHIVRPAEAASVVDLHGVDRETLALTESTAAEAQEGLERYLAAVRDWVRTGKHALPADAAKQRLIEPTESTSAAAAHHRLATYLIRHGDEQGAKRHFDEAVRLQPDRWTYRRDAWALADDKLDGSTPMSAVGRHADEFWAAVDELGERPFYPAVDLTGAS